MNFADFEFPRQYWRMREEQLKEWNTSPSTVWYDLKFWRNPNDGDLKDPQRCVDFEKRILRAVRSGNVEFIRTLLKAMESKSPPLPTINASLAAMEAFRQLFSPHSCGMTRAEWPTKKEVKALAIEILQKSGWMIPTTRQWTRAFQLAGLSELKRSPRKSRSNM
jgi:hypothetical protein